MNFRSSAEALPHFSDEKNIDLFERHHVFSRAEIVSRTEIMLENYCKVVSIEAQTMIEMTNREILPAALAYMKDLSETALAKQRLSAAASLEFETRLVTKLSALCDRICDRTDRLATSLREVKNHAEEASRAKYCRDTVFDAMESLRADVDELETLVGEKYWPMPTYGDLLFGV